MHLEQHRLIEVMEIDFGFCKEVLLNRSQRHGTLHDSLFGLNHRPCACNGGKLRDRLILKQLARIDSQSCAVRFRDSLNRKDRVASEFEEVIVNTDTISAEYFLNNFRQRDFIRRFWRDVWRTRHDLGYIRRQSAPIDL